MSSGVEARRAVVTIDYERSTRSRDAARVESLPLTPGSHDEYDDATPPKSRSRRASRDANRTSTRPSIGGDAGHQNVARAILVAPSGYCAPSPASLHVNPSSRHRGSHRREQNSSAMLASMAITFHDAIPVLPAIDVAASIRWWVEICGFHEKFRHGDPPSYAGVERGAVVFHLTGFDDAAQARAVGEQTMLRLSVTGIDALYAEFQARGGTVHPNGPLRQQPWGGRAFDAIDPCGVCVTFTES